MPSDTWATVSPHWGWLVVAYFFVGGIAGGLSFLAAVLDLFGRREDRPIANLGHMIAAPLMAVGGILLLVDLNRPERFWHMFIQSESGGLMFKWWSPISFGAWGVLLFSLVTGLLFIGVLADTGKLPDSLAVLRRGPLGTALSVLTGILGLFLAGYTGVLLAATNRPLWGDTSLLGLLFLLSGVSVAAALLVLLGWRRGHPGTVHWLNQMDAYSSILELAVIVLLAISLGSVAWEVWGVGWGLLLLVGVVLLGIIVPLALHYRPRLLGQLTIPSAAALVLVGGLILRTVIVMSSEMV